MFEKYIAYLKDNPQGYWFKRKLYGWGWTPVRWQGWFVIFASLAIFIAGYYIGEYIDSPAMIAISFFLMIIIVLFFCYKKGEKPRWQWGQPKK